MMTLQQARRRAGVCIRCGKEELVGRSLGAKCLRRDRLRKRGDGRRWKAGRAGRPPLI